MSGERASGIVSALFFALEDWRESPNGATMRRRRIGRIGEQTARNETARTKAGPVVPASRGISESLATQILPENVDRRKRFLRHGEAMPHRPMPSERASPGRMTHVRCTPPALPSSAAPRKDVRRRTAAALDRNAKVRVMTLARALSRRTEKGKHYGAVTAKALAVLESLLWGFHNAVDGRCFPSYRRSPTRPDARARPSQRQSRPLRRPSADVVNRITRVRERVPDLFGTAGASRWRVIRTSNGYRFRDPHPDCSEILLSPIFRLEPESGFIPFYSGARSRPFRSS